VISRGNNNSGPLFNDVLTGSQNSPTAPDDAGSRVQRCGRSACSCGPAGRRTSRRRRSDQLDAPVLRGVTGTDRMEFVFDDDRNPAEGTLLYQVANLDPRSPG
jgi:hypothetical protein